jgi:hypothetical protein
MAHYALVNDDNLVTLVITGRDEYDTDDLPEGVPDWETYYGTMLGSNVIRCSYNATIRGCYPGPGYTYDPVLDEFVAPPEPSDPEAP